MSIEHLAEDELIILGNDSDLRESIINLIFNSIDAMPQGGRISIITYIKDENIYLEISDNGIGMTEEAKRMIFDPFFTTKDVSHSGLGMSVLYGMIKRHNGTIEIKTKQGEGTSFLIRLPKGKEIMVERDEKVLPVVEVEKAKILVIDDQPEIGIIISETLSSQGHQTHVSNSGIDGIEALKKDDYDILITDLGMPGLSGWDVISIAKQINPRVLIGMVTGWDITVDEAKQKGADFIMNKPFRPNQIKQAVANALKTKAG